MAEDRTSPPALVYNRNSTPDFLRSSQGGFMSTQSKCGIVLASCHDKENLGSSSVVVRYPVDEMHSWICSHHTDNHTSTPRISPSTSLALTHQRQILQHHLRSAEHGCLIPLLFKIRAFLGAGLFGNVFLFHEEETKG